jgi:hypothetical protein
MTKPSRAWELIAIGDRYGTWTILSEAQGTARDCQWLCRCICGREQNLSHVSLLRATACYPCRKRAARRAQASKSVSAEYSAWRYMKDRCGNPNVRWYPRYGGRGIRVCERWSESFDNFFADMGPKPSRGHSLDRIDPDGHYEPLNCRWATWKTQQRNRTNNRIVSIGGRAQTLSAWCEEIGADYHLARSRIHRGWQPERALGIESAAHLDAKEKT